MAKPWETYASQEYSKPWEKYEDGSHSITPPETSAQPERSFTDELKRQAGLTSRIGIEGLSDLGSGALGMIENIVTPAVSRNVPGMQRSNPFEGAGTRAADFLGLPTPENAIERVSNVTGRTVIPVGGAIRGGQVIERMAASPLAKRLGGILSANPASQLQSVAGAGIAGGTAREMGGGEGTQFAAALGGGLLTPALLARNAAGAQLMTTPSNVEARADQALRTSVPQYDSLAPEIQATLRQDTINALRTGGDLQGEALARLGDYRTVGAQPMRSSLTLNPTDVTRDQNLVKMSANSSDPAAQTLANVRGDNQKKILNFINNMGAQNATNRVDAGSNVISTLEGVDTAARNQIGGLYKSARDSTGRSATIDHTTFTNRANDLLDDSLLGGKLPGDVRNKLNSIAQAKTPLTVDVAEQFKTNIGALQRASNDPAERLALAKVREALEEAPLMGGTENQAQQAFNKAREANRKYMQIVESTPALKAVRDGVEPDRFVYDYITGPKSTIKQMDNLRNLVKESPEALDTIRSQILQHLKSKGTGGAADEVASFSPKPFNDELAKMGDGKLRIFFSPEEVKQLKSLGRVASYEKFQPTGSAVNNSNTAATLFMSTLERLGASGLLRKVPLGNVVANQANDIVLANAARKTLDPLSSLTTKQGGMSMTSRALQSLEQPNPALGIGLLSSPE